jgi:hypothetical protein
MGPRICIASDNSNQLTTLSTQALGVDLHGEALPDGHRDFSWDAAERSAAISGSPAEGGAATPMSV